MVEDKGKSVLLQNSAYFRFFWPHLARHFREKYCSRIVLVVRNKVEAAYARKHFPCDEIVNMEAGYGFIDEPVPDDVFETARAYEKKYGVLYSRIIQTDRHAGHAMSAMGTGHPHSELSRNVSQRKLAHYLNRVFAFWEDVCRQRDPWLMFSIGSGLWGYPRYLVLKAYGAKTRSIAPPRFGDCYFWAEDEKLTLPGLEDEYRRILVSGGVEPETEQACAKMSEEFSAIAVYNRKFISYSWGKLPQVLKNVFVKRLWRHLRGLTSYSSYEASSELAMFFRRNVHLFRLNRMNLPRLADIEGRRFFLYCMQAEPETSTSFIAPDFNEQLAIIELLSKSMPSGHYLVVKEHPFAMGRRPWLLYDLVRRLHNVILVETGENSLAIATKSDGVVVLSGTIGFEATLMGKPVLSFGMHNMYNCCENVEVVHDFMEIPGALQRMASMGVDKLEEFKKLGPVFLQAYKDRCFNIPYELCSPECADSEDPKAVHILLDELEKTL